MAPSRTSSSKNPPPRASTSTNVGTSSMKCNPRLSFYEDSATPPIPLKFKARVHPYPHCHVYPSNILRSSLINPILSSEDSDTGVEFKANKFGVEKHNAECRIHLARAQRIKEIAAEKKAIKDLQESRLLQCIANEKQDPDIGPQSAAHLARACQETLAAAAALARAKVRVARSELIILTDEAEAAEYSAREAEEQLSFILAELQARDDIDISTLLMPNMVPDYREPPSETSSDCFMPCLVRPYAYNSSSDGDEVEECIPEVGEQVDVEGAKSGETM